MADFITPVSDILTRLCGYCSKWADSIRNLGDNLDSLKNASNELNSRYLDFKMKVETVEKNPDPELMVLNEVRSWMGRVEVLQKEVKVILQQGDLAIQAKCFGGRCSKNCRATYKLNKMVTKKLSDVNDLTSKGYFDVVAEKCACDLFEELPVDKTVGVESTFEELLSCFQNDEVGVIGLYGMGGVGKTTLLKKFNNDFLSTIRDYVVIWVLASKDADPGKIQVDILKKLRVQDDNWNDKAKDDDKASLLYKILKKKKFVLLLDDVWERIDLLKLGIPSPNNHNHKCKIIFTTRSYEVCGLMDAKRCIGVNCLTSDKAFELFREKVGETTLECPLILPLAMQVVEECKGLPLALCVVGRAMANKGTPKEWKRALEILRSYPSKMQGIVEDVYYLLEFSYDGLPNETYKSCFLYCALFPEDYNIQKEELILMWIAEGFLAQCDYDIHEARKQGEDIISSLKYSCLLEDGEEEHTVKMHDVIRDMALWIACDHEKKTRFWVNDYSNTSGLQIYNHTRWEEAEKLSFWGNRKKITNYFSQRPHCPNLVTLLIRNVWIPVFPTEVFVLSSTIRLLDLSGSCTKRDLPSTIGDFVNLQYMNLSDTDIRNLPKELKNLKKLRFLLLNGLGNLVLPEGVISSLLSLQAFSTRGCGFSEIDENVLLHELEDLEHLQDIRICVSSSSSVKKILISSKLQSCMCELRVRQCSVPHELFLALGNMEHFEVEAANIVKSSLFRKPEHIMILRYLRLIECQNVLDLNWLIHAPNLEVLELFKCDLLEEIISEDIGILKNNLFSNLTSLLLKSLNNLRSICRMTLQFPSLKKIIVWCCPNLKKLPFNSQSALKNLRLCEGEREWFHQLQWEDEDTKNLLSSQFRDFSGSALRP
ncbi:hypothetical protein QN277_011581 [Acacia crassicarpa]|uniref:NB-ARC domain-containing protein n=1 Tax=Acacia crassicarpa TaxID=499986 RepID=A0AAE1MZ37_9FABA|nr:hypothetical protein QN277_011581 [Acacia crassicarpa]